MTAVLVAAAILTAALLAIEMLLRAMGFGSFPLAEPAERGVYRMRADQAGRFMRRHAWRYDGNGMRNDAVPPSFTGISLLVGDSIVDGGLRIDQSETLAALTEKYSGERFYALACPGWSLANGLDVLTTIPGWARARRLVFVLNTGDLDTVAPQPSEASLPTLQPAWLTLWLAWRHVYRRFQTRRSLASGNGGDAHPSADPTPDVRSRNLAHFRQLLEEYPGPVLLVRYPMRGEDPRDELYFEELASLDPRVRILEAADAEGWSEDCYADHIHPNARGLDVLARHLCRGLI